MHDMSYLDRSVPKEEGRKEREMFGRNLIDRSKKIAIMQKMGMDIEEKVIEGRTHNNFNGHGVNELGDQFIKETYKQTVYQKQL